jgi:GNAT superfamily N-acetyltransferase
VTPQTGVTIRAPQAEELSALPAIEADAALAFGQAGFPWYAAGEGLSRSAIAASHAAGLLWAAFDEADPVGFIAATMADANLHVLELSVRRSHQRRGIGRALLERAIDRGRWTYSPAVTLTTDEAVPFNAPFYRSLGFVRLAEGRLPPDLAAILAHERQVLDPRARRIAMAKVL